MTAKHYFIAQGFVKDGRKLASGQTFQERSAEAAIAKATRISVRFAGAVAFEQLADDETGETLDEPKLLFTFGQLPADFDTD
ncbi:hypothetical protein E3C22_16480 [Jiella endophytica]|uniref:Uncharacterized protein n=1 Tax=Jiella endophytica TaxID=2558362 RepID=A0A4Y8RDY8_9HYPH|nr:hypothetical protein [Jiella endophytica]TFF20505.1 hypothetical protein E3C22_16480 [Jiella endophytica]